MSTWQRGDIVVVAFPYTDAHSSVIVKGRPALIIPSAWVNENTQDIIVAAISSRQPSPGYPTDFRIEKGTPTFQRSGLRVASIVKAAVVATIPQSVVARKLGQLTREDVQKANRYLRAALEL